jgi:hypothetical protein
MNTRGVNGLASGLSKPPVAGLGPVFWLTFINSLGTGVVTNGIFFLATSAYSLGTKGNFALGILLGITYIAGAKAVGPLLVWLKRSPRHSTRGAFHLIVVLCALLCGLPMLARFMGAQGSWPVWVLVGLYSPLTGCIWPITEAYLSGGRRGHTLRSALGTFNVIWSVALVVALWGIGPFVKSFPLEVIAGLGLLHLSTIALIRLLPAEPAAHPDEHHEPHPEVYHRLLNLHRFLLPLTYLIVSTMSPYLPTAMAALSVKDVWQTPLAATWHATRVGGFLWLQFDHRWHGRWWMPIAASSCILVGFAAVMLAPQIGAITNGSAPGLGPALWVLAFGLGLLGIGVAAIYTGALYYAMEVGSAQVDAGGTHEALIGTGYTLGPAIGLVATIAVDRHLMAPSTFAPAVVCVMLALTLLVFGQALLRSRRRSRAPR